MNEVKNITDHYGNSQTYNAYEKNLDKISNITRFKTDFLLMNVFIALKGSHF